MPGPAVQVHRLLTSRTERKELLVLACTADRAAWLLACRPARPAARPARDLLGILEPVCVLAPGRLGRWLRGGCWLTRLGRRFGWLPP